MGILWHISKEPHSILRRAIIHPLFYKTEKFPWQKYLLLKSPPWIKRVEIKENTEEQIFEPEPENPAESNQEIVSLLPESPHSISIIEPFYEQNRYVGSYQDKIVKTLKKKRDHLLVEAKIGYFFFSDPKLRRIYDQGGLDFQLSGSLTLWRWLQFYTSLEYFQKQGRSLHLHERVRVWSLPVSWGLKGIVFMSAASQYYLAIGPKYFYFHIHDNSSYAGKVLNQSTVGGFVSTGFNFFPMKHLSIDLFGEYSYAKIHCHPHKKHIYGETAQTGGFTFGAGLGYIF